MAESTGIEWCDATFNPWWGCERVSPGCAHCYADTLARRWEPAMAPDDRSLWTGVSGAHGFRFFGDKHWAEPLKWARTLPGRLGRRPRVFCASMADVFEERPELDEPRVRLFDMISRTPELDWLVLTKRPEFARNTLASNRFWLDVNARRHAAGAEILGFTFGTPAPLPNVWLGVSIENARYTWRANVLREIPAAVRFISAEPLLGSLFESAPTPPVPHPEGPPREASAGLTVGRGRKPLDLAGIDWIIVGGESGPKARPFHLEHAREIIAAVDRQPCGGDMCSGCDVDGHCHYGRSPFRTAVFVKQLGAKPIGRTHAFAPAAGDPLRIVEGQGPLNLADRKGGDWDEWPVDLHIREFPRSAA